jgi:hypothetical protein
MNDIDCAYSIYLMTEPEGDVVVEFRREKSRGDNIYKASYGFRRQEGMSYMDLVNSVFKLDDAAAEKATVSGNKKMLCDKFESEILFITDALEDGPLNQSSLLEKLKGLNGEGIASEVSVRSLKSALPALINIMWITSRDKINNANVYTLINIVSASYEDVKNGSS